MATLSLNTARLRSPKFSSHRPTSVSGLLSLSRPSVPNHSTLSRNYLRSSIICRSSLPESSVSPVEEDVEEDEEEEEDEDDPTMEVCYLDPEADAEAISEWEMDFCSRPILDKRGKKIWELVVCDRTLSLQFTKYFPNNVINSVTLKEAILGISESLGVPLPEKIRFFRSQMQTIITRACNELSVKPIPSKRCVSLILWLEERYETSYTRHPGFQKGTKPLLALDNPFPMQLPENLFGEKWAFVQLPFSVLQEEVSSLDKKYVFGADLDLDLLGLEVDDKTLIPGLAVASSRAKPLADFSSYTPDYAGLNFNGFECVNMILAWTNGLEVSSIEVDINKASLILSTGVTSRYIYATYKKTPETTKEAEAWEAAKKACGGLHFLAIQDKLDSDDCVGFWLLLDLPPPPV